MKKLAIIVILAATLTACTDASKAKIGGYSNRHKVEMYSGGKLVRTWVSSGKVQSEQDSDGYYFNEEETGLLVEVAGDVVITRLKD